MQSASCGKWPFGRLRDFARDDRGNISIFSLTLMVAMIGIGGLALDTMRYEQQRVLVQNTLDRCTLMAASLKQRLDPEDVVYDCMEKSDLRATVKSVDASTSSSGGAVTSRSVDAVAETDMTSLFPNVTGITSMNVDARSKAVQKLSRIEIALVLDVSGSMSNSNRITNLKAAAKEFVSTVLNNDTGKLISISLVPYSSQVNLGPTLRNLYTATDIHGIADVNCLDLPSSVYSGLSSLTTSVSMPMTSFVDTYGATYTTGNAYLPPTDTSSFGATPIASNRPCPNEAGNVVRVAQQDISTLHNAIDNLVAIGGTSINAGMRWGVTLLDPGAQGVYSSLISAGAVSSNLAGRPYAYSEPDVMKIIVLMTDGDNVAEERINAGYRTGLSPIYKANNGVYSIFHSAQTSANKYYVPSTGTWRATPFAPTGGSSTQMTWPEVWSAMRLSYVIQQFYTRAFPTNSAYSLATMTDVMRSKTTVANMNSQLQTMCSLAKGQKMIIYTIALDATILGKLQLSACASSSAHYFTATGTQISSAFRMIATNITQLKLTL